MPLKNDVPSPIEWWSITKKNQVMSWNYQIIWSLGALGLWRKDFLKKFLKKKFFFEIFFEIFDPPEPYYLRGLNNLVISGHNLVPFCYRPSFYRGRNNIFEESQNGYFFNFGKIFSEGCAPMGVKMIFPKLPTKEVLGYRRSSKNQIPLPYIETRFQKSMC